MFVIVPLILIFLIYSYLQLNDVGNVEKFVAYGLMGLIVMGSLYLFKKIKQDMKKQQINQLILEKNQIIKKNQQTADAKVIEQNNLKLEKIQEQIDQLKRL
ncbi:MAG: hypothetical protein IE909_09875 [Campylobacterales bacterium]|nr:hypothetical protein [Campylobacterales bacterium]